MNKMIYSLPLILLLSCCTGGKNTVNGEVVETSDKNSKVINIDDAFNDIREVRLSDIADSVSFLPLETNPNCLISTLNLFSFSPHYIYYYRGHFDWNGKYCGSIVKRGQGPYEEPVGGTVLFNDNHFYSKGSKFIEYDSKGTPTGKVVNLYDARNFSDNDKFRASIEFFVAGKNLAIYNYPTRIYFINTDFETIGSRLVATDTIKPNIDKIREYFITYYKDKTIFYNFMNDTIFYVTDDGLEPQWVVNFTGDQRLSSEALLMNQQIFRDEEIKIFRSGSSNFENTQRVSIFDKKHIVNGAFETNNYVIFQMQELTPLARARNKEDKAPYIVIFDKSTRKTFRIKGDGFVDDLTGLAGMTGKNYFFPSKGTFDEKMIHAVWPHEIFDFIEECQKSGRTINPRLLEFSKTIKEDDNPVIILVHLKRK